MLIHDKPLFEPNGRLLTIGLFKETAQPLNKFPPPFSLAEWKKVYVESNDPTEYTAAMALVGDWTHWQTVRNHNKLKPIFDNWQDELQMKLKSEAIKTLINQSMQPGGTAAAKFLSDKGYLADITSKKSVGRPKKEEPIADVPASVANKLENVLHLVAKRK